MPSRPNPDRHGPFDVTADRQGSPIHAQYIVEGSGATAIVTVTWKGKSKSTQAGNSGAAATAQQVLGLMAGWEDFPG